MKIHLLTAISFSLMLAACAGRDIENVGVNAAFTCPATSVTDGNYIDTFVNSGRAAHSRGNKVTGVGADRRWGVGKGKEFQFQVANFTVADIAGQFNAARAADPTIQEKLIMPSQRTWNAMSPNDKGLFLVNS